MTVHRIHTLILGAAALATLPGALLAGTQGTAIDAVSAWDQTSQPQYRLPPAIGRWVNPAHVLAYVTPQYIHAARNIGLQCQGSNRTLTDAPGLTAAAMDGGRTTRQRFGIVTVGSSLAFRLEAAAGDVLPGGIAPRCEILSYPQPDHALPQGGVSWFTLRMWADDWSDTTDEQIIGQFHVVEPTQTLLNPFFALVVRGSLLRVELRHNDATPPVKATTKLVIANRLPMPVGRWFDLTVQTRISAKPADAPFLKLWLDGQLITDYAGPLGYALPPAGHAYAKAGVYHWTDGNAWDMRQPVRRVLLGHLLTVRDPDEAYDRRLIEAAAALRP